jgi:hypothetical protein
LNLSRATTPMHCSLLTLWSRPANRSCPSAQHLEPFPFRQNRNGLSVFVLTHFLHANRRHFARKCSIPGAAIHLAGQSRSASAHRRSSYPVGIDRACKGRNASRRSRSLRLRLSDVVERSGFVNHRQADKPPIPAQPLRIIGRMVANPACFAHPMMDFHPRQLVGQQNRRPGVSAGGAC